ncbi:heavy metal efflux pump, cobalt-zinc-cadmium [Spongiibacter sp. IMCC21906]|jgi:cobalt-zinc-cadmium resistance protein CzcA|uniref:efflux RND transporter permease subunit n=1 Tax=Spongiibacter sp. IMCC21906 TaxID=1620392 RepID=UPI00062DD11E|nr:CusA/CzcA family heavy metal efflux RND transporter [Spongiibacter sp. IMCC21906]AKH68782.1 heavy metal efflux pump, cobalt-zinc-cadmium [Spongiibacter sp. IMCC21906]
MLDAILRFSLARRSLVMVLVLGLCGLGLWNFQRLPIDAVPDITNVQVMINTEAPGYTPLEVEQRVTYAIETAMAGLPALEYTRSVSRYGLSQVTVVFEESTDIYFARQLVNERLASARSRLPAALEPELGPIATGLGEIFMFTVDAEPGAVDNKGNTITPTDLRSAHDWIIRPQLLRVPGVAEVNPIGGYKREILIGLQPEKLLAFGVTQDELLSAVAANNQNRGAGFVEQRGAQRLLRVPGQAESLEDIGNIVVKTRNGAPVKVSDLATVGEGQELRTGAATQNGREVVMSTVFMLVGENSRRVAKAVAEKLKEVNASLPEGITATAVYDRTKLVDKTLQTVRTNLLEGALLVIVILFLLLGNLRAALLTAMVIPIAMLITISGMVQTRVSANLMSLGALDFGLLVDGAIIIVENCLRRLSEAARGRELALRERLELVFNATREVIRPALFGVFIITAVYLPIFSLDGVEGKMFHPMAITVVMALSAAMLLSITFIPAGIAFLFKAPVEEKPHRAFDATQRLYRGGLEFALAHRTMVVTGAAVAVLLCGWQATRLGSEFVPNLDEGDIAMHALRIPGTSLSQAVSMQEALEAEIKKLPEVERVFAKIGTADVATDAVPPSVADNFIILKPRDEWPDPSKPKAQVVDELAAIVEPVPGSRYEFLQPIQMRFNELLSGVRAELAIKVFGDDLEVLAAVGAEVEAAIADVNGIVDIQIEQTTGLQLLSMVPRRNVLAQFGLTLQDLQTQVAMATGGEHAGLFYEGDRFADIVVRLPEATRNDTDRLAYLPIELPGGEYAPLRELVDFELVNGVNQVNRENGKRRVVVTANVRGRDLGSFVQDVQSVVGQLEIPAGYWVEYGGTYQSLQSASQRLAIVVPLTLVMIIGLLLLALGSLKESLIIFTGIPLALTGGILALTLRGIPFSISAAVGFIALSGIAILNGLVMVSFIRELRRDGAALDTAILEGALTRFRPVITTALVASLGFVPMALNTGIGSEVQRPLASVVVGGIVSSTLLTLFVLPVLYRLLHKESD